MSGSILLAERAKELSGPKSLTLRNRKRAMYGNGNGAVAAGSKPVPFDFKPYPDADAQSMRVSSEDPLIQSKASIDGSQHHKVVLVLVKEGVLA